MGFLFTFELCADQKDRFDVGMKLAFSDNTARFYDKGPAEFVLYSYNGEPETTIKELPIAMDYLAAGEMIWNWLKKEAEYPREPDHDGSNYKGFKLTTTDFYRYPGAFLMVESYWVEYSK